MSYTDWNNSDDRARMRAEVERMLSDLNAGRWPATTNDAWYFQEQDPTKVRRLLLLELEALDIKDSDEDEDSEEDDDRCPDCEGTGMGAQIDVDDWDPCRACNGGGRVMPEPSIDIDDLPLRDQVRLGYWANVPDFDYEIGVEFHDPD
ncbi:MAG: hypothetical protein Unbinned7358contig1000_2 [Prokaryotic dsDNA virus sp.]|nr:MAG: hypothetical protein Unbinned7358contig1000_2 [Prokaryotic dsDNA virus sp.]|tara:strand:+ start:1652 stop:2095 length:444 start_codon:yes stop_codon:yes gene_type:complete